MPNVRILAFSGSARRDSLNKKFLANAVQMAREAGAEVTVFDLNETPIPLYHGDLEDNEGIPENAQKLITLVEQHPALLIASPEYNSMITPALKNALDWCSRADKNPLEGKIAAVLSASPGMYGGVRSLQLAQQLLLKLGCHVIPGQCVLPHADKAFDEKGTLKEERPKKAAKELVTKLIHVASRLGS